MLEKRPKIQDMQLIAASNLLFCAIIALFGNNIVPIVQGFVGILFVLEGYHSCKLKIKNRVYDKSYV